MTSLSSIECNYLEKCTGCGAIFHPNFTYSLFFCKDCVVGGRHRTKEQKKRDREKIERLISKIQKGEF